MTDKSVYKIIQEYLSEEDPISSPKIDIKKGYTTKHLKCRFTDLTRWHL
jgi:hypothetical protein